jgi:hypothetical protein
MFLHRLLVFVLSCILPLLVWQLVSISSTRSNFHRQWSPTSRRAVDSKENFLSTPRKRHHIAVASTFAFHHDVYMSLVWTLEKLIGPNEGTVQTYAPLPFDYEFQKIVDTLGLYQGEVKTPETLVADLNSNLESGGIDMVVLGTCEFECVALIKNSTSSHLFLPSLREDNFWHKDLLSA